MGGKLSEHMALFQTKDPRNPDFWEKLHLKKPSYIRASKKLKPGQNNTVFIGKKDRDVHSLADKAPACSSAPGTLFRQTWYNLQVG